MRGDRHETNLAMHFAAVNRVRALALAMKNEAVGLQNSNESVECHAGQATGNEADVSPSRARR